MARESPHPGSTALKSNDRIEILYDAEVKNVRFFEKLYFCCFGCKKFNKERSYMYVRENSLETNLAVSCICCEKWISEDTRVWYFDRKPFKPTSVHCCHVPCPCMGKTHPKLEVSETGCWCCCQRIVCCSSVVVMPFEVCPFPCCCIGNRVTHGICNCWACCKLQGGLDGNPKWAMSFTPQPKDPWAFLKAFGDAANMSVRAKPPPRGVTQIGKKGNASATE